MNMTFVYVPLPESFELGVGNLENYLVMRMIAKEIDIIIGNIGKFFLTNPMFESTSTYDMMSIRWYVPCSVKKPRFGNIFRVLSMEMWLVWTITLVIVTISTTLVGRYSCTSEPQGFNTLTSSFINLWAVFFSVSVSTMPRGPSLRLLFLAWVFFSLACSTAYQAFVVTFLVDSGYKKPIRNMDELFASDIKPAFSPSYSDFFEENDDVTVSKINKYFVNFSSNNVTLDWVKYEKNVSVLLMDKFAEINYAAGNFIGENSEPLLCGLEDGVIFSYGQSLLMLHADPLLNRVSEIIHRVVEAGLYNYWNIQRMHWLKLYSRKIAIVHPLDGYYSFNLYHTQPIFSQLLFVGFLGTLCFMVEVIYVTYYAKQ
jgi:hypothetical protein